MHASAIKPLSTHDWLKKIFSCSSLPNISADPTKPLRSTVSFYLIHSWGDEEMHSYLSQGICAEVNITKSTRIRTPPFDFLFWDIDDTKYTTKYIYLNTYVSSNKTRSVRPSNRTCISFRYIAPTFCLWLCLR